MTESRFHTFHTLPRKNFTFFSHREKAYNAQGERKLSKNNQLQLECNFNNSLQMKKQYNGRLHTVLTDIFEDDKNNLHEYNPYRKKLSKNQNKYYKRNRNNTVIFDREFLFNYFTTAVHIFIYILRMKGNILVINTNPELSKLSYHIQKNIYNKNFRLFKNNIFFSDCGWTNGTLTNSDKVFNKIKTFINFYTNYNTFLNKNNIIFPAYTKMKKNYKGFISNDSYNKKVSSGLYTRANDLKPDLIVFLSITNCKPIIKEANSLNIPIIGFVDNDSPIDDIQYPIFGNTRFYSLIWLFFTLITKITNYTHGRRSVL